MLFYEIKNLNNTYNFVSDVKIKIILKKSGKLIVI